MFVGLKRIQKKYDVFIFTAAQSDYGNLIIDRIAPHIRECRRFFRDSCVNDLGYSVKDLSVLRTNLKQTLLVDDIVTTGATLLACAQALQAAQPASLSLLTLSFAR